MKIVNELPPSELLDRIVGAGMNPSDTTIFAYGDTIYNPSGNHVSDDIIVHEETHSRQQGENPALWWDRYLTEPFFRLDQETEAYANQYKYLCSVHRDRNHRNRILMFLAEKLSGPLYGNMISKMDAYSMIKVKAGV